MENNIKQNNLDIILPARLFVLFCLTYWTDIWDIASLPNGHTDTFSEIRVLFSPLKICIATTLQDLNPNQRTVLVQPFRAVLRTQSDVHPVARSSR